MDAVRGVYPYQRIDLHQEDQLSQPATPTFFTS